jgi:hypothetical protein
MLAGWEFAELYRVQANITQMEPREFQAAEADAEGASEETGRFFGDWRGAAMDEASLVALPPPCRSNRHRQTIRKRT